MKKLIILLLCLLILMLPVSANAMPSPLTKVSSGARVFDESSVQVISYKAYLKVESNTTYTTASLIVKNTSEDAQAPITVGLPSHINEGNMKLNQPEVVMDGTKHRLTTRRNRQDETSFPDIPPNWLTWVINLEPGEYKVIDISYHTENRSLEDGTQMIFIPLGFLRAWSGTPQNIQLTLDLGETAPYQFEPNPSVLPHEYNGAGQLTWSYHNTDSPEYLQVHYLSIEKLASEFLTSHAPGDRSVANIVESFHNKSYGLTIALIDQYLESQVEATLRNELLYLQALSHQSIFQTAEAIEIFNRLEGQPIFGELEGTFKNRIIYDKNNYMHSLLVDDVTLYEYLDSARNYVMGNALFLQWIEEQLDTLELPPEPEPSPEVQEPLPEDEPIQEEENVLVKAVNIAGYEIAVETLFLGILALVILIALVFRKKKNKRNRGYLFR